MERVEAELRGWPQAPYETKAEVDANFKRLLDVALRPEHAGAVRVGRRQPQPLRRRLGAGRARGARRPRPRRARDARGHGQPAGARGRGRRPAGCCSTRPIVRRDDFEAAVAYLVRRLDENTAPENFLRRLFALEPGSPAWDEEAAGSAGPSPTATARRGSPGAPRTGAEPRCAHRRAIGAVRQRARHRLHGRRRTAQWIAAALRDRAVGRRGAAVVDGDEVDGTADRHRHRPVGSSSGAPVPVRRGRPRQRRASGRRRGAAAAASGLAARSGDERRAMLHQVAAAMAAERGTRWRRWPATPARPSREADPEVSEAIDFARYYGDRAADARRAVPAPRSRRRRLALELPVRHPGRRRASARWPPATPSSSSRRPRRCSTAALLARQCWAGGRARTTCSSSCRAPTTTSASGSITHPGRRRRRPHRRVGHRPAVPRLAARRWRLHAETSGKNAIVITAAADLDDAIRDLVRSAFGHAGQKCSAASLAIVEAPVYDDPRFQAPAGRRVRSLRVGPAAGPGHRRGPADPPAVGRAARASSPTLDPGEQWLVEPGQVGDDPHLWSPGRQDRRPTGLPASTSPSASGRCSA